MSHLRSLVLRQAGLIELCRRSRGLPSEHVALIDGAVHAAHPAFDGCRLSVLGRSASVRAGEHATFCASVLVGSAADRQAGRVMAICPECTLVNVAVVTDDMLAGLSSIRDAARALATAVRLATQADCRTIVFGIEIRRPESAGWMPLRESLRAAAAAGSVVIFPAGNRPWPSAAAQSRWPETLIVGSRDWRGRASIFSPLPARDGTTIFAPGEDVPGAGPDAGYVVRSGTSFAAAIAAGALALARAAAPWRGPAEIVADLFRPPSRALDASPLFTPNLACHETGEATWNQ
ncbi:MAG TPA: S8 family serine peptidase [Vicinamibacterales bacterium]|nr:S8 family serine peptidase [Vicinamibacterales bacterium]